MRQRTPPNLYDIDALAFLIKPQKPLSHRKKCPSSADKKRRRSSDNEALCVDPTQLNATPAPAQSNENTVVPILSGGHAPHRDEACRAREGACPMFAEAKQPVGLNASVKLPLETSDAFLDALAASVAARAASHGADSSAITPVNNGERGETNLRSAALTLLHCSPKHQALAWYVLGLTLTDNETHGFPGGRGGGGPSMVLLRKLDCYHRASKVRSSLLLDLGDLYFRIAALTPAGEARHTAMKSAMRAAVLRTRCWVSNDLLCAFETMAVDQITVLVAVEAMYRTPSNPLPFEFMREHMQDTGISEVRWSVNMPWWPTVTGSSTTTTVMSAHALPPRLCCGRVLTLAECLVHATLRGGAARNAIAYFHLRGADNNCIGSAAVAQGDDGHRQEHGQHLTSVESTTTTHAQQHLPSPKALLQECLKHHPSDHEVLGLFATSMAPGETIAVAGGSVVLDKRSALLTALVRGGVPATAAYAALPVARGDTNTAPHINFVASRSAAILAIHLADLLGAQECIQFDCAHRYGPTHLLALATTQIQHADVYVMLAMKLCDPVHATVDVPGRGIMDREGVLSCAAGLLRPTEADAHVNLSRALRVVDGGGGSVVACGVVYTARSLLLKALAIDAECAGAIHDLAVGTPVPDDNDSAMSTVVPELGISIQEAIARAYVIMSGQGTWDRRIAASANMLRTTSKQQPQQR